MSCGGLSCNVIFDGCCGGCVELKGCEFVVKRVLSSCCVGNVGLVWVSSSGWVLGI